MGLNLLPIRQLFFLRQHFGSLSSSISKYRVCVRCGLPIMNTYHTTTRTIPASAALHDRSFSTSISSLNFTEKFTKDPNDEDQDPEEVGSSHLFADPYLQPIHGHRVVIIHPELKSSRQDPTSSERQLLESCALIDALPGWTVLAKEVFRVRVMHSLRLFTKGTYATVSSYLRTHTDKTAVFVDVGMLTGLQLATLQRDWKVPVYDRYTLVLQIFRQRARTKEAKLQVALAEIPYYRSRLRGMHEGDLVLQRGGLDFVGGSGETWMDRRYEILAEKERALRSKLAQLKKTRDTQRTDRKKREIPLVAVVGYTNSGKTSLIKALTRSASLVPLDQLFATLDVTCHGGFLSNNMRVIFMDTVGFISNIPTNLIESFKATLDDITTADVLIHVRDISHPDSEAQNQTVIRTLQEMGLPQDLLDNMIHVCNKADLIQDSALEVPGDDPAVVHTSVRTGEGLPELVQSLETVVIEQTQRTEKHLRIPTAGTHLSWLYREATVTRTRTCDTDPECLLVDAIMTPSAYERFRSTYMYGKKKRADKR